MLTTDYLTVTDADALARLLDLAEVRRGGRYTGVPRSRDQFPPQGIPVLVRRRAAAATFVGSNNLSASGIAGGVEWAIGADQAAPLLAAFERLWSDPRSQPLTHDLLADYRGAGSHRRTPRVWYPNRRPRRPPRGRCSGRR